MIIDAGPFISDSERLNSRLWALVKRAAERGEQLHTTHPVLAQVWRDPARQANLSRAVRHFDVHALDESVTVGRRLAATGTADVVDAHLVVVAEQLAPTRGFAKGGSLAHGRDLPYPRTLVGGWCETPSRAVDR